MRSPIPWAGGKARLAKHIVPHIPEHTCWVEPFAGGLGMFFNKPKSKAEVINDIHQDLVNLFRVAKHHPEALQKELELNPYSRAEFERLKKTCPSTLTDIQRAAWFTKSLDMSFGGQGLQKGFGYGRTQAMKNRATITSDIAVLAARLATVTIECLDYREILKRYDGPATCFFMDPPYIGGSLKTYSAWKLADMQELAGLLPGIKGTFMLTTNDSPELRELFAPWHLIGMERQTCIENRKGAGRTYKELLVLKSPPHPCPSVSIRG
jgi:DNA adenine methylase